MEEKNYDVLILFSGGADSRLLLEFSLQMNLNPFCVLIDYEQKFAELPIAIKQLKQKNIDYQIVQLHGLDLKSALTSGDKGLYENVSMWNVPSRNLMFISMALSIAESKNIKLILHGADASDRDGLFPDCYQEFFYNLNKFLKFNTDPSIRVEAPLLGFTKEMVLSMLNFIGVKKEELFSGYGDL